MPEPCTVLIDQIIELRKRNGWTQKELAKASGLTQSVIARIESKKTVPTLTTLQRVVTALGAELTLKAG